METLEILRGNNLITGIDIIPLEDKKPILYSSQIANSSITGYYSLNRGLRINQVLKIIYVLPVEALDEDNFGNGIEEIKELMDLNEIEENVLFIQPRYVHSPWYGNNPTPSSLQQESDTISFINAINNKYSMFETTETYLLGYSKSGWGAMNLQLKNPNLIDGVLIWDAPLAANDFTPDPIGMGIIFDNVTYFQNNYHLNNLLVTHNANLIGKHIVVGGYSLYETLSTNFLTVLDTYPLVNYTHNENLNFPHSWNGVWIKSLLRTLTDVIIDIPVPIPIANITSEYKFEDNVLDTVGSKNGTPTAITYVNGLSGKEAVFNGSTSRIQMPSNMIPADEFSVTFLAKVTGGSAEVRIIGMSDNADVYCRIAFNDGGNLNRIGYVVYDGTSGASIIVEGYDLTNWTHITVTAKENESSKIYVNGLYGNGNSSLEEFTTIAGGNYIGCNRLASGSFVNGSIDNARIWNKALTPSEALTIATNELAGENINP